MLQTFLSLVVCLGMISSGDSSKISKPTPVMSNSFTNLGKMDITFHINSAPEMVPHTHGLEMQPKVVAQPLRSSFFSNPEPLIEEPCPCSSVSNMKNSFLRNPSTIVNKILSSNDLFSNHEPASSVNCCDSHENAHEDTVFFEIGPNQSQKDATSVLSPMLPFIFENLIPKRPMLPALPIKPNVMELLLIPKEKTSPLHSHASLNKIENTKKAEIQKVGDKELRNDFKTYKYRPSIPVSSLMKKEVNPEQVETTTTRNTEVTLQATVKNLNAL